MPTENKTLQEIAWSINEYVDNPKNPRIIDRVDMPFLSVVNKMRKTGGTAQNKITIKYKRKGNMELEHWEGSDRLGFQGNTIDLELTFDYKNTHLGFQLLHDDIRKAGFKILPNQGRSHTRIALANSEDEARRLVSWVTEKIEEYHDNWDRLLDLEYIMNISADPKAQLSLNDILPMDPTAGNYGGKSRTDPILQHHVANGVTTGAGGTLHSALTQMQRKANLASRGNGYGKINAIFTGAEGLDRYSAYAKESGNGFSNNGQVSGNAKLDIGTPDTGLSFNKIPIIYVPTFDEVAQLTGDDSWLRRFYMLNTKTFKLFTAPGLFKHASAPDDPADQRLSKLSLDQTSNLVCEKNNGNAIVQLAA